MQDWLTARGVEYPEHALKRELYAVIKASNVSPKYAVDEMAKATRHELVRLPPYHCELNPIELAWSQVKRFIKEKNMLFTLTAVKELTYKGFEQVVPAQWKKLIDHVQQYRTDDGLQEEIVDEFCFFAGGPDDDTSSESDSSESVQSDSDSD